MSAFRSCLLLGFWLVAVATFEFARAAEPSTPSCPAGFEKVVVRAELERNTQSLLDGSLVVRNPKTGQNHIIRAAKKTSEVTGARVFQPTSRTEFEILAIPVDEQGRALAGEEKIGVLRAVYGSQTRNLEIENVGIYLAHQKQGLSTFAISALLKEYPLTSSVSAKLVGTNGSEFIKALREARASGGGLREAFEQTPIYRSLNDLGFSEIDMNASQYDPTESNSVYQIILKIKKSPAPI